MEISFVFLHSFITTFVTKKADLKNW